MNTPPRDRDTGWYRIRVEGRLEPRWATRFEPMALTAHDDGTTLIQGRVDQAALHGLLQQVRDTGLPLISVRRAEPDRTAVDTAPMHRTSKPSAPAAHTQRRRRP